MQEYTSKEDMVEEIKKQQLNLQENLITQQKKTAI